MDRVAGSLGCRDQVVWVENPIRARAQIFRLDWIDVVNKKSRANLVTRNAQVAAFVAQYDYLANVSPLTRLIELLVHPAVETKSRYADFAGQLEVIEPSFKRLDASKFLVRPKPRHRAAGSDLGRNTTALRRVLPCTSPQRAAQKPLPRSSRG